MVRLLRSVGILGVLLASGIGHAGEARLLRYADIHRDRVAFVFAGDIWVAPSVGGQALRLTSDEGMELFPKFSPDGHWIAFSAEYGGNRQVWVVSADGGTPRQLTYYNDVGPLPPRGGFDYQVLDWTPDGRHVLVRANRLPWSERMGRPYLVPVEGGMERPLAVTEGGTGMLSPDGRRLVYTPIDREFRTWKRYVGGRAQDVWIYDLEADSAEKITDWKGTDNQPTWVGDTIYFTSDREGGRLNLWAWDTQTRQTRRVTEHADFDVLWPSAGPDSLVYECGGWLWRLDPGTGRSTRLAIELTGDFPATLPQWTSAASRITSFELSRTGKRALIGARGEIFSVPAKDGEIRNVTQSPVVREIGATASADGKRVAYLSDRTGEYEIWIRPADGTGIEHQVTHGGDIWRFDPVWSPDGKKLAFGDKRQRLRYVEVDSGRVVDVDRGTHGDITTYRFSPDSRWLTYSKVVETRRSAIYVHDLERGANQALTSGFHNDDEPVFDPGGRYLYFLSDRDYALTFSAYEFNYLYADATRVYVATLAHDGPVLLRPKSDDEPEAESSDSGSSAKGKSKEKKKTHDESDTKKDEDAAPKPVKIDVAGFENRVKALPGDAGRLRALSATHDAVTWLASTRGGGDDELKIFRLDGEETKTVLAGVQAYALSGDGKKVLYSQGPKLAIVDLGPDQKPTEGALDLTRLEVWREPRAEWSEIYLDAWRILRDWFYDPKMHGVDWVALRDLYAPLVRHVAHRADLDYILGELGGELAAGHVYVDWGDFPRPTRVESGLLGAEIAADPSGYFRIEKIFPGENWDEQFRSPLTEPGVDVAVGDLILAVDGRPTSEVGNFYSLLQKKAGRQVRLKVHEKPELEGAREIVVRPVAHETNLRYLDWVRSRRERVDRLSGGRIGYIHLPNTAVDGNRELQKYFLPQATKDALIIDVRYNGGGFIPDRMIELVARTQLSFWVTRADEPTPTPGIAHSGPKVCLINGHSSSGGDAFPYYFRKLGLGKLIGTRTWGGLIGLSGNPGLVDGGAIQVPTFRFMDTEGAWAVENVGVAPDIEVVDRPELVARGQDPTLERAVAELLSELSRNPPRRLTPPLPPTIPR